MNSEEKIEMLKTTIEQLYSKEGRSMNYISHLLQVNRHKLSFKIKEWKLPEAEPRHHFTPSIQKFVNKNRNLIKSRLDNNISITNIADELKISRTMLQKTIIPNDKILNKAREDYINRQKTEANEAKQRAMNISSFNYDIEDLPDEIWKSILGYEEYMISNKGRIKHYAKRYNSYHLLTPTLNKNNNRLYVMLQKNNKRKNIQVAHLVAHTFVSGYSDKQNTVNHNDGNPTNNVASNLSWVSQSENNIHSYRTLKKKPVCQKKYEITKILYKNKYEFKTIAAFARFLHKSETQTRRYIDHASNYDIKLIK